MVQLHHHDLLRRADLALLLDVRMVHHPCAGRALQGHVLPVRLQHDRAVPDGHVHPGQNGRYPQAEQPLQHLHHLSGLRRRSGGVHVHRLCQVDAHRY